MATTLPNKSYSVWISTKPYSENITDDDFMYVGSSNSFPQSITYNSSTVGIIGQSPDTAIFVDGTGGAVMNITINADRVNPVNYVGLIESEPSSPKFGDMYRIDGGVGKVNRTIGGLSYMHGVLIVWNGTRWCNVDTSPVVYSNKKFIEKLTEMRTKIQMTDNAYILRIYNATQISKSIYDAGGDILHTSRENLFGVDAVPRDTYIYINTIDIGLSVDSPNEIAVSMNLIQRNKLKGYNE